jgi:hypothetical protein
MTKAGFMIFPLLPVHSAPAQLHWQLLGKKKREVVRAALGVVRVQGTPLAGIFSAMSY